MAGIVAGLLEDLWEPTADGGRPRIFALLDAARDPAIRPAVAASDCRWCGIYRGVAARTLADVAPYLVQLERRSRFAPWLLEQAWGQSWGIFLKTADTVDLAAVRKHLRGLTMARLPDGKLVYFRFYDPRVLRVYLPTCTPQELDTFFGPVETLLLEAEDDPAPSLAYRRTDSGGLSLLLTLHGPWERTRRRAPQPFRWPRLGRRRPWRRDKPPRALTRLAGLDTGS